MLKQLMEPFQHERIPIEAKRQQLKKKSRAKNTSGTIKRIWLYLADKKTSLLFVLIMVLLSSVFALLGPYLVGKAIDEYVASVQISRIVYLLVALAIVYTLQSLTIFLQNFWMVGIAQNTVYTLRKQLFHKLQNLPIPFFDKRRHGELMSRVTNDIENVSTTLNDSVIQIFSSVLILVGTFTVMLFLSPFLTVVTLIIVPVMVYGMKWITKRTQVLFKERQKSLGELNGYIEEIISGQKIVKTFSQEDKATLEFKGKNKQLKLVGFWAQVFSGFIHKLMNMLNNFSFAIIAGVGGVFALHGWISIGTIVIFAEYARQFTRPLNELANQFNTLLSAVAGAERVFDILDEQEEQDSQKAQEMPPIKGDVKFTDVSFSYEKEGRTVSNINFHAKQGETIAFVGPTGVGKTTLINLLARFYDADSGMIQIDNYDITNVKRHSLRRDMAFVLQDAFLFEDTIRENIRFGKLDATDSEIVEAAKLANTHAFINSLPERYDTVLTQGGSGISQGQKQLITIARAILANPAILIMDEATSSIDTVTELKIQDALNKLMKGRTSFVIAHRLNTIQKADQILVMEKGQIIEKGTHDDLLKQKGNYYNLYQSQFVK